MNSTTIDCSRIGGCRSLARRARVKPGTRSWGTIRYPSRSAGNRVLLKLAHVDDAPVGVEGEQAGRGGDLHGTRIKPLPAGPRAWEARSPAAPRRLAWSDEGPVEVGLPRRGERQVLQAQGAVHGPDAQQPGGRLPPHDVRAPVTRVVGHR